MKRHNPFHRIITGTLLLAISGLLAAGSHAATVTLGTSTPAVGDGVQNLNFSTNDASNTQLQYVDSDYIGSEYRTEQGQDPTLQMGQSFTTGTNVYGYSLSAISVRHVSWGPTDWDFTGGTVILRIFDMNGNGGAVGNGVWNASELTSEIATVGGAGSPTIGGTNSPPQWLTVTLATNVTLAANTLYGFAIGSTGGTNNQEFFMNLDGTSTNLYASGFAFSVPPTSSDPWDGGNGQPSDRAFVATMTAAPPPPAFVWDGDGSNDDWTNALNWVGDIAPATSGNSVVFAGNARPTPNMNNDYSVPSLTFSNDASSFIIGTATGNTLTTGTDGIANNSPNTQTLNVPIVLGTDQAISAATGSLVVNSNLNSSGNALTVAGPANTTFNGAVSGSGDLTKIGNGTLTLASTGTDNLGNLKLSAGQMNITAGVVNVNDTSGLSTRMESNATLTVSSGATLNIGGSGGWWPVGVTSNQTATIVVDGGTINVTNSFGTEIGNEFGSGLLTINDGIFINNDVNSVGLQIGAQVAGGTGTGTVNLNGGLLMVNSLYGLDTGGSFFFNGGTLKPLPSLADFWPYNGLLQASIRDNGAVVDTTNVNVTIAQPLIHSTVGGDNAVDGGLTKIGSGTLTLSGGYTYTGPTKILGGSLGLDSAQPTPFTPGDLVISNAALVLNAPSGYSLPAANLSQTNAVLTLNYGDLFGANPVGPAINVSGSLSVTGTNNIIVITGSNFDTNQFPLIQYGSGTLASLSGFQPVVTPPGVIAELTNNTANQSVDLIITSLGRALTWHGTDLGGSVLLTNWDINISTNWYDALTFEAVKYREYDGNAFGDGVTFGDSGYNTDGTNRVNLAGRVVPSSLVVDSTTPYMLTGAGGIDGSVALTVNNATSFFLGTSNNYTGGTFINAGTLIITNDSALGTNAGSLTMAGGTLQVGGNTTSARAVNLSATSTLDVVTNVNAQLTGSITGAGGLTKNGDGTLSLGGSNTYSGASTVSGGTLQLSGTYTGGGSYTVNSGGDFTGGSSSANTIGNLAIPGGSVTLSSGSYNATPTGGNTFVNNGGTLTVNSGAILNISNSSGTWFPVGTVAGQTGTIVLNGGTLTVNNNYGTEIGQVGSGVLTVNSGTFSANCTFAGNGLQIGGSAGQTGVVNLNGGTLKFNQIQSGAGSGTFYFNGGTLSPLLSTTSFFNSGNVSVQVRDGGANIDTAGFDVTFANGIAHSSVGGDNPTDGGLTKTGSGTLTLTGANAYTGNTTINAGALALGQVVPTLATNSTVSIAGGAVLQLVDAVTNQVAGLVTNGVPAADGLYTSANSSGFITGAGTLQVGAVTPPTTPVNMTFKLSGTTLTLEWPETGWSVQAQTNPLSVGLLTSSSDWYTLGGYEASTQAVFTIQKTNPTVFYRLSAP